MEQPKWIINDNNLVMGIVGFHKDLLSDHKNKTIGGGLWYMDRRNKKLYLYSKSQDFGQCVSGDIYKMLDEGLINPSLNGYSLYFSTCDSIADAILKDHNEFIGVIDF